ncbi:hypothetical protein METP2_01067 [Methanosarcinales archaeon]|uniref:hypothetical protein n=1 Tax=Candidatus Methanoperedens sp. BLZ2 TaxID=2035255 RepID=UPI000BE3FEA5|nr:hypothetical protein [Candidatus Methanoperedens sp. BLZ2]KAB2943036.1 MAG: hypothetical protein F9K14_16400 [Candidatus Methanoperedens sp.]MBZ0176506.1 hypothetical protein [Candidatus Methanoperedens nitroreducens]CAG0965534.1 hypothetical protein METP2_01067 [Methanosarcinales archaeon]MCX9078332.1 hypothetical protein [Candidatus Methanoperedens sp.]MCX9086502.1 hypothetical protein [Candidatus Methanoperedens sp.]
MQGATLSRENSTEQRSSSLDRVEVNSTITPIRLKEDTRKVSTAETAIKRPLMTVYEDSGITAGSRNRWKQ